jgi:hypothetical protein
MHAGEESNIGIVPAKPPNKASGDTGGGAYFPESRELEVEFHPGEIYRCLSVPPQAYYDLPAAPSKGGYYNVNIRNRFDFQKSGRSQPAQKCR